MTSRAWHVEPASAVLRAVGSSPSGLAADEAARRLIVHGRNELEAKAETSPWRLILAQFTSPLIWLLVGAAVVSGIVGDLSDAWTILAIVVINAAIGFYQEWRAERSLAALRKLTSPQARVRRETVRLVPAVELVPGDVVELEEGDLVPADGRVIDASELRIVEAALTGESQPVVKQSDPVAAESPLAERASMVFMGTAVAAGSAAIVVVETGMRSELGRIASLLQHAEESGETPLARRLRAVGKMLAATALGIVALVFLAGLWRGLPVSELFLTAISLAVAAVPEGLPAVVTVALAVGVQVMARRRALVRRLHAVETLGSTNVICSDKTGTLTVGQMTVRAVSVDSGEYEVTGEGYAPEGAVAMDGKPVEIARASLFLSVLRAGAACNGARLVRGDDGWSVIGDPTEGALLAAAAKTGINREGLDAEEPVERVIPFDSNRKRMTTVRSCRGALRAYVKGAPDVVLRFCSLVAGADGDRPLDDAGRAAILERNEALAARALRVLAVAWRPVNDAAVAADDLERDLVFGGLIGMQDPLRPEAAEAVHKCRDAGIQVVMITGDQPATAAAIARELGILGDADRVVSGKDLDSARDGDLGRLVSGATVYARVTAAHKLDIVRAWRKLGGVVAMTGDGVNDAPALKGADIGIAMGRTGTEVTKEAADIVIADDRFATIVEAVEQGRGIYDNIRKTLQYLLAGNVGELLLMAAAIVAGLPVPLVPIQLLWINLATDGIPALCLAVDRIDSDVMRRKPRPRQERLTDGPFLARMLVTGTLTASVALAAFLFALREGDLPMARGHAFAVLVFAELFRALGARSDTRTIWEVGLRSNVRLAVVVGVSIAIQVWSHHSELWTRFLKTPEMPWSHTIALIGFGTIPFLVIEGVKVLTRRGGNP
jgi:Ca2+-transporting ATPase